MALPATIKICELDLFTAEDELRQKYDAITVARIIRIRDLYSYLIANPDTAERQIVDRAINEYGVSQRTAYSDLSIVKALLPALSQASKAFHRWRGNEMLLETYRLAREKKDTKTMERAASSYLKYNGADLEDEQTMPYDEIVVQPFTATSDPTPLGIKPIPNIQEKIKKMLDKYTGESMDIEDVEYEEYDLEENELFNLNGNDRGSKN